MNLFEREIKSTLEKALDHYERELEKVKVRLEKIHKNHMRGIAALDSEITSLQAEYRAEVLKRSAT